MKKKNALYNQFGCRLTRTNQYFDQKGSEFVFIHLGQKMLLHGYHEDKTSELGHYQHPKLKFYEKENLIVYKEHIFFSFKNSKLKL